MFRAPATVRVTALALLALLTGPVLGQGKTLQSDALQQYRALARTAGDDVDAELQLALWCRDHGLVATMRRHARAVLALQRDHETARELLGHIRVRGRWLPYEQGMRTLGYRHYQGRWRRPEEIEYLKRAARQRARAAEVQERIDRLAIALADPDEARSAAALQSLRVLARTEKRPDLAAAAQRDYWRCRVAWMRAAARQNTTAIVGLRLQHVELLGIDTVPVSFGTGGGGRLQLPRTRSISFGGTVAIPVGR